MEGTQVWLSNIRPRHHRDRPYDNLPLLRRASSVGKREVRPIKQDGQWPVYTFDQLFAQQEKQTLRRNDSQAQAHGLSKRHHVTTSDSPWQTGNSSQRKRDLGWNRGDGREDAYYCPTSARPLVPQLSNEGTWLLLWIARLWCHPGPEVEAMDARSQPHSFILGWYRGGCRGEEPPDKEHIGNHPTGCRKQEASSLWNEDGVETAASEPAKKAFGQRAFRQSRVRPKSSNLKDQRQQVQTHLPKRGTWKWSRTLQQINWESNPDMESCNRHV